MAKITVGKSLTIPSGTYVRRAGVQTRRTAPSVVTVRATEQARDGRTRVFWKSHGVLASALI